MQFANLYETVRARYGSVDAQMSMGDWMCANTTLKRRPFSFDRYPFQKAIADDMHPDLAVEKASQIGLTEVQLRKFLGLLARNTGLSAIFSFPDDDMKTRQYNSRIKPILEADPVFNPITTTKPTRRADQVQILDSFGYITGCSEGDATSTSADVLFHDELDLSPEPMIALFQSRLQNSDMRMTQAFSTPTFLDFGINKIYKTTDMREYFVRCGACNHYQIPKFTPRFVQLPEFSFEVAEFTDLSAEQAQTLRYDEAYVCCEHCRRRLDLSNASVREWVATYPTRTSARGYKVRPFSTDRLGAGYVFDQMIKYKRRAADRSFHNTVLGEPYAATDAQIQEADILACMQGPKVPDVSEDTPVYLGVDIGITCHLTLSIDVEDQPVFILFETFHQSQIETRITELRKIYTIVQGCGDRYPYTPTIEAVRDASHGLIMPIDTRGNPQLAPQRDEVGNLSHYNANRTSALDRVHTLLTRRAMVLTGYTNHRETLIAHLRDMRRDDSRPDKQPVWVKTSGNDHFFHSMSFNLLSRRVSEHMYATGNFDMRSHVAVAAADVASGDYEPGLFGFVSDRARQGLFGG